MMNPLGLSHCMNISGPPSGKKILRVFVLFNKLSRLPHSIQSLISPTAIKHRMDAVENDNDVAPDLVTLDGEGTGIMIFLEGF